MGRFYLINASWIVRKLYSVVKLALPTKTIEKVYVLGKEWREEILLEFDPKIVPLLLKLHNRKGNPNLNEWVNRNLSLSAGAKKEVIIDLDNVNIVKWKFKVLSRDINFHVLWTNLQNQNISIVDQIRVSCSEDEDEYVEGIFDFTLSTKETKERGGILVLCWDNSHSWMRGNTVDYEISTVMEEEEGEEGEKKRVN